MSWSSKQIALPSLKHHHYLLLALTVALGAIYLTLVWRSGDSAHLGMSILFGLAAANSVWEKRHSLRFGTDLPSIGLAALLIGLMLWQSATPDVLNPPAVRGMPPAALRVMPLVFALAVCLFASGYRRLKQYWQELTILFFLGIPSVLVRFVPDISPITAKFSAFLLWYLGFDVSVQGDYISLPTGSVQVYSGCSGMESMIYLLGMSVVCLLTFPIQGTKRFFVPIIAVLIGYFVNLVRVALMAVLVASQNKSNFLYWHIGTGSLVFGAIAIILFGLFYFFLMQRES